MTDSIKLADCLKHQYELLNSYEQMGDHRKIANTALAIEVITNELRKVIYREIASKYDKLAILSSYALKLGYTFDLACNRLPCQLANSDTCPEFPFSGYILVHHLSLDAYGFHRLDDVIEFIRERLSEPMDARYFPARQAPDTEPPDIQTPGTETRDIKPVDQYHLQLKKPAS